MAFNLSVTAQELNSAITKANAAAPQSTTYTKSEVDAALSAKLGHDIPTLTESILDYAVSLPTGIYFARHGTNSGVDKPVAGYRYMYQIMKYTPATITLIAYDGQDTNSGSIYMKNYISNTWGPWIKFTGTIAT